jgi:hypothetical protein
MKTTVTLFLCGTLVLAADLPVPAPGNVTLPLVEYDHLLELANHPVKTPDSPPFAHVLKSAQMNLEVAGESVKGTIVLDGDVLAAGLHPVPLVTGMVVLDAQNRGTALPLEQHDGALTALLQGPADFAVTLKSAMPLAIETGRASFTLPVPAAGVARLTLTVPGEQTAVNLSPGLITSRSSRAGQTTIEATLVTGQPATLWWAARLATQSAPQAPKEIRFLSDVKTLITVGDSDVTLAALVEITVLQGEPLTFAIQPPDGYELTTATGPSLLRHDVQGKTIVLRISGPSLRSHQFLLSFTKPNTSAKAEVPLLTFQNAQRETGEVLIESEGTMELTATPRGGLRRMDLKETSPYLRSLARAALHDAYRYQKKPAELPALALDWTRFPETQVLSAVAQHAVVTTLVTSEGRSLTEVKLTLTNQSQPFLKIDLPAGASILSADVAGEKVKPVVATDGNRVPLLRSGFRPTGAYVVSFMFQHAGAPFGKKGGADLALPKMDIPIGLVEWEVFLPARFKVEDFGGDVVPARLLTTSADALDDDFIATTPLPLDRVDFAARSGQLSGVVTDPSGAVVPYASIQVTHIASGLTKNVRADGAGRWSVSGIPSGRVRLAINSTGFQRTLRELDHDESRGTFATVALQVGSVSESVTVTANAASLRLESQQAQNQVRQNAAAQEAAASSNVADLQRRVVGVLPIAVSLPRAGTSYRFARPLVLNEDTRLTFTYRNR